MISCNFFPSTVSHAQSVAQTYSSRLSISASCKHWTVGLSRDPALCCRLCPSGRQPPLFPTSDSLIANTYPILSFSAPGRGSPDIPRDPAAPRDPTALCPPGPPYATPSQYLKRPRLRKIHTRESREREKSARRQINTESNRKKEKTAVTKRTI